MTDEAARALAERWHRAGGGYLGGMLVIYAYEVSPPHFWSARLEAVHNMRAREGMRVVGPDLRDPATRGAALEIVRQRWREPSLWVGVVDESVPLRWQWGDGGLAAPMMGHQVGYDDYASEGEALVAAIEAAPKAPA
jgi:hypothetical protein